MEAAVLAVEASEAAEGEVLEAEVQEAVEDAALAAAAEEREALLAVAAAVCLEAVIVRLRHRGEDVRFSGLAQ